MREVVTLQVGAFANFVGSHFWNFQDELVGLAGNPQSDAVYTNNCMNMDVLYRTGESHQGVCTYTPRLVSIDFQGSLGTMNSRGTLYNDVSTVNLPIVTWMGNVTTQVSEPRKKNLFLQSLYEEEPEVVEATENGKDETHNGTQDKDVVESLENGVKYWTDFSKVHYHPQSLYGLNGLWMDAQEFDNYGIGKDVCTEGQRGEEMNERLRFFVEECDHIQELVVTKELAKELRLTFTDSKVKGIKFVVDDSGGFSGVAADFLENIADEYTNIPVILYSVRSSDSFMKAANRKKSIWRNLNDAISFSRLSSLCKLIVPVGLPFLSSSKASKFLHIDDEKLYHSSAVYAAALHSIGLPLRMELSGPSTDSKYVSGAMDVNGIVQMLSGQARQNMVAIMDIAMPAPPLCGNLLEQSLIASLQPLTPETDETAEDSYAVEYLTIHGAPGPDGGKALIPEVKDAVDAAYEQAITRPMFSHLSISSCPLPIPLPFPSIFSNRIGQYGELLATPVSSFPSKGSLDVHSVPISARLRSSTAILPFLQNKLGNLRKFGIQRGSVGTEIVRSWGFGDDEVQDMGERLSKMVMALDPHSDSSSDSD